MAIRAFDHYSLHETVATSIGAVRQFITDVTAEAERLNSTAYWRGQVDHRWGVTSSLSRMSDSPTGLSDADLRRAESDLIEEAKRWVTSLAPGNEPTNELEWLALLQHMGVPTRLIDFTPNPLIATFFASESDDDVDGRLFAILIPKDAEKLTDAEAATFKINDLKISALRLWEPPQTISPRVAVQSGVFALAKLPTTSPSRLVVDVLAEGNKRQMLRSEVVSIMSIPLSIGSVTSRRRAPATGTVCYTARIHVDKAAVREQLARRAKKGELRPDAPIDHAYCYPDVPGMMSYSKVLRRIKDQGI